MTENQKQILDGLNVKATLKATIYDECVDVFNVFKEVLSEISNDTNDLLEDGNNRRIHLEYRDRGKFEAELKFADDVLIFSMHTDVFCFDREHPVRNEGYVKGEPLNAYCGIINVYNFLYDSLKYNREEDTGYLVARIFINREKHFFVEGKRQKYGKVSCFGNKTLGREEIKEIIESAIIYSLSFDLLVPPFEMVDKAMVSQMNSRTDSAKLPTAKRTGFSYNSDDVLTSDGK